MTRINYKNEQVEPTSRYKLIELESFKEVIKAGHRLITEEVTIIKFQILTDIMEETFIAKRETINKSTKKNLRRNVEKTFKEALKFLNHEGSLYVYPNTLTFDILLKMFIDQEDDDEKNGIIKKIESVSNIIRNEIKTMKDTLPWPPQSADLMPDKFKMPSKLEIFLNTIYSGANNIDSLSARSTRYKLSLAQDLVYTVSDGKIKTPKSILYPCTIKSLTNNTELINITNRLGHGISYTLLMELFTENAYKIQDEQLEKSLVLPLDTQKDVFTIYVADNIDRLEETLTGNKMFPSYHIFLI